MKHLLNALILTPLACIAFAMPATATPAAAERARLAYQLGIERWVLATRLATNEEERLAADRDRPDPAEATAELWRAIANELDREWILPHAAWFIEMADSLGGVAAEDAAQAPAFQAELTRLLNAIREHHLASAEIAPVALALARRGGPERLALLERISRENPDASARGVASLAQAIAMKALGDEPPVLARRLELIREAIIHSADVTVHGDTTVADIAEEEVYIIRNLTRGRTAPDLTGTDTAGRQMRLSDHDDKVVILIFWSAADPIAREVVDFAAGLHARMRERPVEVIGVNLDDTATLRPLEADGTITWRNFSDPEGRLTREYRVTSTPICFVLDRGRTIKHIGPPGAFIELTALSLLEETP